MQPRDRRYGRHVRSAAFALVMFIVIGLLPIQVLGEEGMFMPDKIAQLPWDKFKKRGVKITPFRNIQFNRGQSQRCDRHCRWWNRRVRVQLKACC